MTGGAGFIGSHTTDLAIDWRYDEFAKTKKFYINSRKKSMRNKENFSRKYLESNFLIKKLIRNFYQNVEKILYGLKFKKILEVGCGPGFSTQYLSNIFRGKKFEASEYKEELVEEARQRNPGVKILQESIYKLKREGASFDLVVALEVLEHLDDPERAVAELNRVTSKYLLLSVPNEPIWRILNVCRSKYLKDFGNTPGHLQHWSRKQFIQFLSKFVQVKKTAAPLPWTIVLAEKQ